MKPEDLTEAKILEIELAFNKAHPIITFFQTRPSLTERLKNCKATCPKERWLFLASIYKMTDTPATMAKLIKEYFESAYVFNNVDGKNKIPTGKRKALDYIPYKAYEIENILKTKISRYFSEKFMDEYFKDSDLYEDTLEAAEAPKTP
jgi:hypothetical protein